MFHGLSGDCGPLTASRWTENQPPARVSVIGTRSFRRRKKQLAETKGAPGGPDRVQAPPVCIGLWGAPANACGRAGAFLAAKTARIVLTDSRLHEAAHFPRIFAVRPEGLLENRDDSGPESVSRATLDEFRARERDRRGATHATAAG